MCRGPKVDGAIGQGRGGEGRRGIRISFNNEETLQCLMSYRYVSEDTFVILSNIDYAVGSLELIDLVDNSI